MVALNGRQKDVAFVHSISTNGTYVSVSVLVLESVLSRFISAKHEHESAILDEGMGEDITEHIPSPIHRRVYRD